MTCDQLRAAIAEAGGADTDVSKTKCSVAGVKRDYTEVQATQRLLSRYDRDLQTCSCPAVTTTLVAGASTASIVVSSTVPAGSADGAASAVSSQAGTAATSGARSLSVGHREVELRVLAASGVAQTVKAMKGSARAAKPKAGGKSGGVKAVKKNLKAKAKSTTKQGATLRKRSKATGRVLVVEDEHARRLAATTLRAEMGAGTKSNTLALAAQSANRLPVLTFNVVVSSASPSPTASASPSPTGSRTVTPTPTAKLTRGASPSNTGSNSRTPFPSPSNLASRSRTPSPSSSATPSGTKLPAGASQSSTPSPSPFPSASPQAVVVALTLPAGSNPITVSSLSADAKTVLIDTMSGALGVPASAVTIIAVRAVESRRLLSQAISFRRRLDVTGYIIDFAVSTSAVTSAAAAQAAVQTAITNGYVSSALAATDVLSQELDVSRAVLSSKSMYSVSATLVAAAAPSPVPAPDSDKAKVAAILGGVLGSAGAVALFAITYHFAFKKVGAKALELRQPQLETVAST